MSDAAKHSLVALRLSVNNHPGVMSHVCGLFARRAFNMEGILVTPEPDRTRSRMWILVNEDSQLEQMVKQVRKLHDCLEVSAVSVDDSAFGRLDACMRGLEGALPERLLP